MMTAVALFDQAAASADGSLVSDLDFRNGSLRKCRDGRGIGRGPFYGEHLLD